MSDAQTTAGESTFRPAVLLMAGRGLASIATLLIPVTLVRVFDQAEYGTYKQLFLVFTTLYSVALVGLSDSLYYFVPRDPGKSGRYVANAVFGLTLAGILCLIALDQARFLIAGWMKNEALSEHLVSIGVFLLFTLVATVLEISLIARKRYTRASAAYVVSDVVRALCFILPVLFRPSLHWLMLWAVIFSATRLLAALALLRREFGGDFRLDPGIAPGQLAYALPFALYVLVEILQSTWHQYAVSWTFDAATFAIYSVGCFQVPFVDFLATPASSVMMVRMSEEMREGRPRQALAIWLDITRKLALIFFPLVAFLVASSREIITFLFTDLYSASAPIFALWVLSIALSAVQTDGVMRVHAQIGFLFRVNLLRLALVVILMQPLMATFGLKGPVLVTLLAMGVAKGLHLFRMRQVMGLKAGELLPWPSLGAIASVSVMAVPTVVAVRALFSGPRLVALLAEGAAYVLVYLLFLFATGIINAEERAGLRRLLRIRVLGPAAPAGAR